MKFTKLLSSNKNIYLVLAADRTNRACYFFLRCNHKDYDMIKRSFNKRHLDLTKYGEVIASGWGHEVSDDTKLMLKQKFDVDVDELV